MEMTNMEEINFYGQYWKVIDVTNLDDCTGLLILASRYSWVQY